MCLIGAFASQAWKPLVRDFTQSRLTGAAREVCPLEINVVITCEVRPVAHRVEDTRGSIDSSFRN